MKSNVKIAIVTSTRAEYGLFYPLISEFSSRSGFEPVLIVAGTHLSYEYGFTVNQIEDDGFEIAAKIDCTLSNDTPAAIGKTSGLALIGITEAIDRIKPDIIFLLGDRYETLCAAYAANLCRVPIAHIHGGEITEGAYDEGFRHAVTKMSHLHFTSTAEHKKRVIQMGEDPITVYDVGAIGLDNIKTMKYVSREELERQLKIKFREKNILMTVHPETLSEGSSETISEIVLQVLDKFSDVFFIITGSNADSESRTINNSLKKYSLSHKNCFFIESLGLVRYLSTLNFVDAVLGNSSSGIIEVPTFGIPTINIGDRQKGRMRADSVIDVEWDIEKICSATETAINTKKQDCENPYGDGNTTKRIIEIIQSLELDENVLKKKFFDIGFEYE